MTSAVAVLGFSITTSPGTWPLNGATTRSSVCLTCRRTSTALHGDMERPRPGGLTGHRYVTQ